MTDPNDLPPEDPTAAQIELILNRFFDFLETGEFHKMDAAPEIKLYLNAQGVFGRVRRTMINDFIAHDPTKPRAENDRRPRFC